MYVYKKVWWAVTGNPASLVKSLAKCDYMIPTLVLMDDSYLQRTKPTLKT